MHTHMTKYNQKGVEEALESLKNGYSVTGIFTSHHTQKVISAELLPEGVMCDIEHNLDLCYTAQMFYFLTCSLF